MELITIFNIIFDQINWDPDPIAVDLWGLRVRWYGIAYAASFLLGHYIISRIFKIEGKTDRDLDKLTIWVIVGVIVGARLGHVLFYDAANYFKDPITILHIWEGGMASHGSVIGIILVLFFYSRKRPDQPFLWVADRLCVTVSFGACMVRLGNLVNSEIVGNPTTLPWGFIFVRDSTPPIGVPRHPVVLYEAIVYIILFVVLLWLYFRIYRQNTPVGLITGLLLTVIFVARFLLEFFKTPQETYTPIIDGLTTGQLLSVPAVVAGVWILIMSLRNPRTPLTVPANH